MRSPYGAGGTPTDLGRVMYRTPRRAYALRSASTPDGYVSAYGRKPRTARRQKIDTTTNLVEHVDAPIRRYQRTDYDAERKLVPTVVMADF
jgi:hypothetical protein